MSNALKTDRYELSMLETFIESGKADEDAVFEVFTRRLPQGRRFGVFAGLGRLMPMIEEFQFTNDDIAFLLDSGAIKQSTADWLHRRFMEVKVDAYLEGDLFFPNSPVLTVRGKLGECILLETLILSVLNFDSAIATTAARMHMAADGRPLIEMGSRRVNEEAAVAAARAAFIAGFDATSNLEAGSRFGIPTRGTAAHAFTLAYDTEREAFEAQVKTLGVETTLLVDTYNIEQGIRTAIDVAGTSLGAIRIDSGDLANEAEKARMLLDSLGAYSTKIIVTSDLDEHVINFLGSAPISGYGVGTKLVASQPMGFVYKLVEINGVPKAKAAKDKVSVGGRKVAWRLYDEDNKIVDEVFTRGMRINHRHAIAVQEFDVKASDCSTPEKIRERHLRLRDELPLGEQKVWPGEFGPFVTCTEYKEDE